MVISGIGQTRRWIYTTITFGILYLACQGQASASLSSGVVAVVSHVPKGLGSVTHTELHRVAMQVAADEGIRSMREVQPRRRRHIRETGLFQHLSIVYIEGEAAEKGVVVTEREVSERLAEVERAQFSSHKEYRRYLRSKRLTPSEARRRIRAQLLDDKVVALALRGIFDEAAQRNALEEFAAEFRTRWWGRTSCKEVFHIAPCRFMSTAG